MFKLLVSVVTPNRDYELVVNLEPLSYDEVEQLNESVLKCIAEGKSLTFYNTVSYNEVVFGSALVQNSSFSFKVSEI